MNLIEPAQKIAAEINGTITEKKGLLRLEAIIAERKTFLSKKKLTYIATMRADDTSKTLHFSEMLKESGWGLSSGDSDTSPGFGFKTETYNTFGKARIGNIEEQSNLFGKKYSYKFEYQSIREKFEKLASEAGYKFEYQILPVK